MSFNYNKYFIFYHDSSSDHKTIIKGCCYFFIISYQKKLQFYIMIVLFTHKYVPLILFVVLTYVHIINTTLSFFSFSFILFLTHFFSLSSEHLLQNVSYSLAGHAGYMARQGPFGSSGSLLSRHSRLYLVPSIRYRQPIGAS